MSKGRPPDPRRARRGTGNRPVRGAVAAPALPDVTVAAPALPDVADAGETVDLFLPPADLPAPAREVWNVVVRDLVETGHLRASDVFMVRVYCEAAYVHAEASANVHRFGLNVKTADGRVVTNPMLRVQKDAATTMRQVSDVLGLNPLARIRAGLMEAAGASMVYELRDRLLAKLSAGS